MVERQSRAETPTKRIMPTLRILADDRLASVDFAMAPLTLVFIKGSSFTRPGIVITEA